MARVARAMTTTMRVMGDKKGKGDKAIAMATRVAGEGMVSATKRVIVMKRRELGKEEGNGEGGKSNGNGEKDGKSKQRQQ